MLTETMLRDVVESVLLPFLGEGLAIAPTDAVVSDRFVRVSIVGDHEAELAICCGERFARRLAAVMFDSDPAELADDDVGDALGELTNMTGGAVKSYFPGVCTLGIPDRRPGEEGRKGNQPVLGSVVLDHAGDLLRVEVYGEQPALTV